MRQIIDVLMRWMGAWALLGSSGFCFAFELTAHQVMEWAKKRGSVEGVLAEMPESVLFQHLLVYRSRSSQFASPRLPRVLLRSQHLRMAYNGGDESFPGAQQIELIEFQPDRAQFEIYKIEFSSSRPVKITPRPKECMECHHNMGRPVWLTALGSPEWPGLLGSSLAFQVEQTRRLENQVFADFVALSGSLPRYSRLGLQHISQGQAFDRYRGRNIEYEEQLGGEMAQFFVGEIKRRRMMPILRSPLLNFLNGMETVATDTTRMAESFFHSLRSLQEVRSGMHERFLKTQFDRSASPEDAVREQARVLAGFDHVLKSAGQVDLWNYLSTHKSKGHIEIPFGISPRGGFQKVKGALIESALHDYFDLNDLYLPLDGSLDMPSQFFEDLAVRDHCAQLLGSQQTIE